MKKKFERVYQFKITVWDIRPPIWRRIQVPETYTFWDLHVAIQDAMGWVDYHLHEFGIISPKTGEKVEIGIPDEDDLGYGKVVLADWKQKIADYFTEEKSSADYMYDFGDGWVHTIELEKILPREKDIKYPICIKGKRACPPEDCGGIGGYYNLLKIISDPDHEEYESMIDWVGGEYDPEHFDLNEVSFDDPDKRFKIAFG